jgi:hypothetical protein
MANLPKFDDLPKVKGPDGQDMPQGCTWGIWDKNGKKDIFGTINLLTPQVVQEAYKEARDGHSISLNLPLNALVSPGGFRKALVHKVHSLDGANGPYAFDDEVEFNTQSSTQWDSLVHFLHPSTGCAYNGVRTNTEELTQNLGQADKEQKLPTLQHWHSRGGLVARGVLLDYQRWAKQNGKSYEIFKHSPFTSADLEACAKDQGVEFRVGDVLIVRSGFVEYLRKFDNEGQTKAYMSGQGMCGLESSVDMARWLWNKHFSAVASDTIAVESLPPMKEGSPLDLSTKFFFSLSLSLSLPLSLFFISLCKF